MKLVFFLVNLLLSITLKAQTNRVLLINNQKHLFSSTTTTDLFSLRVVGSSVLKGKVYFTIADNKGRRIHQQSFEAVDLLGDLDLESLKEKEDTIRKRVATFFNEEQFIRPAIKPNEVFHADYSDKQIWYQIKASPNTIGFIYSWGYEGTYFLAYSKKLSKAVIYYESD